jgi:methionyl-tRNA formyltransferase
MSKILLLGSDAVSHFTVKSILATNRTISSRLEVLCRPPTSNSKTPLSQFHKYLKEESIKVTPFTGSWEINHSCQIGIIASFGHMVPSNFIDSFPLGMYVMHPSLLPKYRGACPIQHAILNRESETGVSVIEISKDKFDAGSILAQIKVPLSL